jgi:hypothetical protein
MFKKTVHSVVVRKLLNTVNLELVKMMYLQKDLKLSNGIFVSGVGILFLLIEKAKVFILPTNLSAVQSKESLYLEIV